MSAAKKKAAPKKKARRVLHRRRWQLKPEELRDRHKYDRAHMWMHAVESALRAGNAGVRSVEMADVVVAAFDARFAPPGFKAPERVA